MKDAISSASLLILIMIQMKVTVLFICLYDFWIISFSFFYIVSENWMYVYLIFIHTLVPIFDFILNIFSEYRSTSPNILWSRWDCSTRKVVGKRQSYKLSTKSTTSLIGIFLVISFLHQAIFILLFHIFLQL